MKIVQFYQRESPHNSQEVFYTEDVVVVEMTQEEYQLCCQALLNNKKKSDK